MKKIFVALLFIPLFLFADWRINFDEQSSILTAENKNICIKGKLYFFADVKNGKEWLVASARDAVKNRLSIVDTTGDVQGYIVFPETDKNFKLLFYHRTAQAYSGKLKFSGDIIFKENCDTFTCKTSPQKNERVLGLLLNGADSNLNNSIFNADTDTLLRLSAENLTLQTLNNTKFYFSMCGEISESNQSIFSFEYIEDYFKKSYVPYYKPLNRKRCRTTPSGWMSWNTYFDTATAQDNLDEARIGKKYLQPFGCEIWSIESWQGNSDKLPVRNFHNMNLEINAKQFPLGMKRLADDIKALGFKAGLWVAPFGTGNVDFYNAHKDWFLHDTSGNAIRSWNGNYTLDPTVEEAREHLKNIFRIASKEWGYEFFKIDGMSGRSKNYCAHLYERPEIKSQFKNPNCKNPFELCVSAFREGIGDDALFLACQGHSSGPEAMYADMARTGADIVSPNKPVMWKNILLQARCTVNQIFTHNISMIADPDTLLVGDLDVEQARVTASVVALTGQLTFFGDKLAKLSPEKMKILQQALPVAKVRPQSLYPYFSMLPVWNLAIKHNVLGNYNVVAFFNWSDSTKNISIPAEELGLCNNQKYVAFEFWTQSYLGECKQTFTQNLAPRSVRVLVLQKPKKYPFIVGSDRHITSNFTEIKKSKWNAETCELITSIDLIGGFPLLLSVLERDAFLFKKVVSAKDISTKVRKENGIIKVEILSQKSSNAKLKFVFEKK